ncbi:MAG: hypothetical protein K6G03_03470 [Lachnospiraceae bacterium]|nr:hypothetical protein [Lachnospiraceae bacterium]
MISEEKSDLAVFFSDTLYLENFLRYVSEKNAGFCCSGFTSFDKLKKYTDSHHVALLLTDEKCLNNETRNIGTDLTIVLTEDPLKRDDTDLCYIDILQPLDVILRNILKRISDLDISLRPALKTDKGSVYCFCSPAGRCLKTTLSVAAAELLSQDSPALYLNLEPVSGFSALFGESYDADISDLLFFLRDEVREKYAIRLGSMVRMMHEIHYIPPAVNPGDIGQITGEDIKRLLEAATDTGYRNIVMDMGIWLPSFEEILEICDKIYVPIRRDLMSGAKLSQILSYLKYIGKNELSERMKPVYLPEFNTVPDITTDLRGTEIGKFTAEILR